MFALLGIAAHLSIQIHAQQRAEQMIQQWGEKAGVSIGDVRYHLLRNGLILQNIHIQRGDDSINIEHLLVRADLGLLTSNKPRIGKVALSGLQADIHAPGKTFNWQQDQHLKRIWQATTALTIRDGNMKLHLADSNAPPLELTSIFMRQRLRSSIRHLSGNGLMHGGTVNWQWQISAQHSVPGQGAVNWQHVEAAAFTKSLGLKQTTGHFSGQFDWQSSPSDSNIQTINAMQAAMITGRATSMPERVVLFSHLLMLWLLNFPPALFQ
ncbi:MAG: hypothetical protein ACE5E3_06575 [Mariprofundus sp.]